MGRYANRLEAICASIEPLPAGYYTNNMEGKVVIMTLVRDMVAEYDIFISGVKKSLVLISRCLWHNNTRTNAYHYLEWFIHDLVYLYRP